MQGMYGSGVGHKNGVIGGYQLLARTGRAANTTFGDCVDQDGNVVFVFGPNNTKSTTVSLAHKHGLAASRLQLCSLAPYAFQPSCSDF